MELSRRVRSLPGSSTLAVLGRARQLRSEGVDVLTFAAGEPDFDTPAPIIRAAQAAMEAGRTRYAPVPGDPDSREAIAAKLTRENRIPDVTADHIVITSGGKHALYLLFQCLLDSALPGQDAAETLLPTPAWVSYAPQIRLAGGKVVEIPTTPESGFKITPAQLEASITANTRLLVFNSPSNPCGVTYTPDEVESLAQVVARAAANVAPNLVVITDEIYEKLVYHGMKHRSFAAHPDVAERTITVNGLSKAYAMTGWRVGYIAGSGEFGRAAASAVGKMQSQTTTCIPAFIYPAIRVALEECAEEVESMRRAFERRAELIESRIAKMPGLMCPKPTGAFYIFPDVSAHFGRASAGGRQLESALDFAEALLLEHHLAAVPGEDFLGCGRSCVRFSFACSEEQIEAGMDRLEAFLAGLR